MLQRKGLGKGLGKGLDSLIVEKVSEETAFTDANVSRETFININSIEPNNTQPRKDFDEDSLQELANSIKQHGIIQPLIVQKKEEHYEIIAGERRWRAARLAGEKQVPVIIKEYTDQEVLEIALIENLQREDLNPIEEANAYQRLIEEFHLKQDEVAERVAKGRTSVTNSMRLLKLDLNSEQKEKKEEIKDNNIIYQNIEEKMKKIFGSKVMIKRKAKDKGRIEIEYYSMEELERIIELIGKIEQ